MDVTITGTAFLILPRPSLKIRTWTSRYNHPGIYHVYTLNMFNENRSLERQTISTISNKEISRCEQAVLLVTLREVTGAFISLSHCVLGESCSPGN